MKFKIKFQQTVQGVETCECVIDAKDEGEALRKLVERDFTMYLVLKQDAERELITDVEPEFKTVAG